MRQLQWSWRHPRDEHKCSRAARHTTHEDAEQTKAIENLKPEQPAVRFVALAAPCEDSAIASERSMRMMQYQ